MSEEYIPLSFEGVFGRLHINVVFHFFAAGSVPGTRSLRFRRPLLPDRSCGLILGGGIRQYDMHDKRKNVYNDSGKYSFREPQIRKIDMGNAQFMT